MAPYSSRIPAGQWENHRSKIVELIQTRPLADTRRYMRQEHDFDATERQYLRKLRTWGLAVCHIKKEDWKIIFYYLQALSSQGKKARVIHSGKQLSKARIDRARRYTKGDISTNSVDSTPETQGHHLQNVTIEEQQQDGTWILYKSFTDGHQDTARFEPNAGGSLVPITQSDDNIIPDDVLFPYTDMLLNAPLPSGPLLDGPSGDWFPNDNLHSMTYDSNPIANEVWTTNLAGNNTAIASAQSLELYGCAQQLGAVQSLPFTLTDVIRVEERSFLGSNPNRTPSVCTILDFSKNSLHQQDFLAKVSVFWAKLEALPSTQLLNSPIFNGPLILRQVTDSSSSPSSTWDHIQRLVQTLTDTANDDRRRRFGQKAVLIRSPIHSIQRRFPGLFVCSAEETWKRLARGHDMFETMFNRALMASMMNGLVGLGPSFAGIMFKHLRHHSTLFSRVLNKGPYYLVCALVQTLYDGAIKAEDDLMLQWLFDRERFSSLRDKFSLPVFRVACRKGNTRLIGNLIGLGLINIPELVKTQFVPLRYREEDTDLELLMSGGDLSLCRDALATMSYTHPSESLPCASNLLMSFLKSRVKEEVSDDHIQIVRLLVKYGAMTGPEDFIKTFDEWHAIVADPLFRVMYESILDFKHQALAVSVSYESDWFFIDKSSSLARIIQKADDDLAVNLISQFQQACQAKGCGQCLKEKERIEHILRAAAATGLVGVLRLFLRHEADFSQCLSLAIRNGAMEAVQLLLSMDICLNSPPHDIGDFICRRGQYKFRIMHDTTPLAEAVLTGKDELVMEIERRGGMGQLDHGLRFRGLITAAAAAGNCDYLSKLLQRVQEPNPRDLDDGLRLAIAQNRQDMFDQLFNAGASTRGSHEPDYANSILSLAIGIRNEHMVLKILEDGETSARYKSSAIETWQFSQAAIWGSVKVLTALRQFSPGFKMYCCYRAVLYSKLCPCTNETPAMRHDPSCEAVKMVSEDIPVLKQLSKSSIMTTFGLDDCLQVALRQGDKNLVQALLELGADPFSDRPKTDSLANAMDGSNHKQMLRIVLDRLSDSHVKHKDGRMGALQALEKAIWKGPDSFEVMESLLNCGLLDRTTLNTSFVPSFRLDASFYRPRTTILHHAIQTRANGTYADDRVLQRLLEAGVDVNGIVYEGNRSEWPAAPTRDCAHEWPSPEESSDFYKCNALNSAIATGHEETVKFLLENGANPNPELGYGIKRTPLQKAAEIGSLPIVRLLLGRGANVNAPPAARFGATAFQFAAISGNTVIAAELLRHEADVEQPPSLAGGRWPLEGAAEHGRDLMIEYLCTIYPSGFPESQWQRAIAFAEREEKWSCKSFLEDLHRSFQATGSFESVIGANSQHRDTLGYGTI